VINYREEIAKQNDFLNTHNVRDDYKHLTVPERQAICASESLPFSVCIINLLGDLNTGIIIRTACLMGAQEVITIGRNQHDARSEVGATNYIKVSKLGGIDSELNLDPNVFINAMIERNLTPVFAETGGNDIRTINWNTIKNPCFVFGNESKGIPDNILATQSMFKDSVIATIKQRGVMRSLNVSSSAAIILNEYVRNF
jgi:tRNA G18 (ribose-2'-O)-methylase SpoU